MKSYKKSKKHKLNKTKKIYKKAGEVIAAGGFGCILRPQLHCEKDDSKYNYNGISKLMTKKYADEEMAEITKIKKIVKEIPNSNRYFLLDDVNICKPKSLSIKDKKNYRTKCKNLNKKYINSRNINNKLNLLKIINMPYAGIDIDKFWLKWHYIKNIKEKNQIFNETNNTLIDLLKNGIMEINRKDYFHSDIKGSNILITQIKHNNKYNTNVKLIDWGLSEKYDNKNVLDTLINKPIQYNLPFSSMLFSKYTNELIESFHTKFIEPNKNHNLGKYDIMKINAYNIYNKVIEHIGEGHINFINYMLNSIYKDYINKVHLKKYTKNIILNYLTEILYHYVDSNNKFDQDKYFKEVYSKNIDIWGFLMCYLDIPLKTKNPWNNMLSSKILSILINYCFNKEYSVKPIPIDTLIDELLSCNDLLLRKKNKKMTGISSIPIFNPNFRTKSQKNSTNSKKTKKSRKK